MEKIKFSIIIPVYNVKEYISICIYSILNQDYQNYEIIVVNDGSTDASEQIICKINNNKIKIINKENGGLASARNEGIKYATGDYIWFVDGDDYIERDSLKILSKYIEEKEYDIISFRYFKDYNEYKILQSDNIDIEDEKQYPLVNTSACTKIFRREFYTNNRFSFTNGKIYEDLSLIPFIMCKTESVKFIEEPLYNYVYRNNSIMNISKNFNKNRDDKFFAIDTLYTLFKSNKIENEYKEELEYLTIKHLLIVYSTEIFPFKSNIYKGRCIKVIEYLNNINEKWYKNKYLKKSSILTKLYVWLFRKKFFLICKISLILKK